MDLDLSYYGSILKNKKVSRLESIVLCCVIQQLCCTAITVSLYNVVSKQKWL